MTFPNLSMESLAHRDGCHRWHSCPSDDVSYVCEIWAMMTNAEVMRKRTQIMGKIQKQLMMMTKMVMKVLLIV